MKRKPLVYDYAPVKTLPTASDTPAICTWGGQLSDYQRLKPTTNHHSLTTLNAPNGLNALNAPNALTALNALNALKALKAPICTLNQH